MPVTRKALGLGLVTVAILAMMVDNIVLRRTLHVHQEDCSARIKQRAVNVSDCQEMVQKERQSKQDFKTRIINTERDKGGLYLELDRHNKALNAVQKSLATKEEKTKEVEALTKTKEDLKTQVDEAGKRATEADKVKADLEAKLTEAQTKQKEAETAAAAAKEEAAKAKEEAAKAKEEAAKAKAAKN